MTGNQTVTANFTAGSVTPQSIRYTQEFSSGKPADSDGWEYYSSGSGARIEVVSGQLRMDRNPSGTYILNEAILRLDLSGQSKAMWL